MADEPQINFRWPRDGERFHRRVWAFFDRLVGGGYPDSEKTMDLAYRSILKNWWGR